MEAKKAKPKSLQLRDLQPGDLIHVVWYDASIGVRMSGRPEAPVDVAVDTFGIFIGSVGVKTKQLIISQNGFQYSDGEFDIDYTAVPSVWVEKIAIIQRQYLPMDTCKRIFECFVSPGEGGHTPRGIRKRRTRNHA